jgi:hypothetical protein
VCKDRREDDRPVDRLADMGKAMRLLLDGLALIGAAVVLCGFARGDATSVRAGWAW